MSDSAKLLQQLIAQGKAQGLTQVALARRAGITAEALSRAKKAGDMRVSTLADLARGVGLRLALVPDSPLQEKIESGRLFE
jgi:DNA-binding phage protein